MAKYKINEKDIEGMIRILKVYDPENATREVAVAFLERAQDEAHMLSHTDHDLLIKMYEEWRTKE